MEHNKNILSKSNNSNRYLHSSPNTSYFLINSRLKRNQQINYPNVISNYSQIHSYNYKMHPILSQSKTKNISHRDFHTNVHIKESKHKSYRNKFNNSYFHKKEAFQNKFKTINKVENDLDMLKIQMSCDLITYKINQIKNRVQNLHESSIRDDKHILSAKTKPLPNRKYSNLNNKNNTFTDNYSEYNYSIKKFQNLNDLSISNIKIKPGENPINNYRQINNYKIPSLNISQNKKYVSNKNALKFILLNSSKNNQNIKSQNSLPLNNNDSYFNLNNSNLLKEKKNNNYYNNKNLEDLNKRIMQSYQNKKKILFTEPKQTRKILKFNSFNEKKIKIGDMKRNDKKKYQENSFSNNPIEYGSFDQYFFNNNIYEKNNFKSNNYNNRVLYNPKYNSINLGKNINKNKIEQINKINKIINKNNIPAKNKKNFNIVQNKIPFQIKENIDNNIKLNYKQIHKKNELKYLNLKPIQNSNRNNSNNNQFEINKGINNFNYYVNKEGNIVQNNFINNNFNLKNNVNDHIKNIPKAIPIINKVEETKNRIIRPKSEKNNNTDYINIKHEDNYLTKNNALYYKNLNNNNIKNNFNFSTEINYFSLNNNKRSNTFNKNKVDNNINKNYEKRKEEKFSLHNNYSKDDIFRNSVKYNFNCKPGENNNGSDLKEENIFDLIIKEEKEDNLNQNDKNFLSNNINPKENERNFNFDIAKTEIINANRISKTKINKNKNQICNKNELKYKLCKNPNINIQKIIKYKEQKVKPRHKELCHKFTCNPQHFFTEKLNELMLKALNLKKK